MNYSYGSNADQYLNKKGLEHLIEQLDLRYNGDSGTVDLTDYYNKTEIDNLLANIDTGGGTVGSDGRGIQSVELINYELIITLTDDTVINLGNIRGEQGLQGIQGLDGTNGTDGKDGVDGVDGTNGRGITSIVKTDTVDLIDTYTITYTDATTSNFTVTNGKDGADGEGGSGGGTSFADDYTLNTELAIGKWVDGKVLYRKTIQLNSITLNTHTVSISTSFGTGLIPVKVGGVFCTDYSEFVPIGFWESTSSFLSAMFTDYNGNIKIYNKIGTSHGTKWAYGFLWLEYTK